MENKCDCYHIQKKLRYTYHPLTGRPIPHDIEVGVCWGTKETDECRCEGDRTKCDFYPEVREKAKKETSIDKIITRADRIRAMTDEELAKFIISCDMNDLNFCHVGMCLDGETCFECVSKWLKQGLKDEDKQNTERN